MDELVAFLDSLARTAPDAITRCDGWTAHDLLAHLVAGTEEMTRLTALAAAGRPVGDTRDFAEREARWRALPDPELRDAFLVRGAHFVDALGRLPEGTTVPFTGWDMTADALAMHARSELALHRWDLVGDDDTSARLLAQPELLAHGRAVLANMSSLSEAQRVPEPDDDLLTMWGRR